MSRMLKTAVPNPASTSQKATMVIYYVLLDQLRDEDAAKEKGYVISPLTLKGVDLKVVLCNIWQESQKVHDDIRSRAAEMRKQDRQKPTA